MRLFGGFGCGFVGLCSFVGLALCIYVFFVCFDNEFVWLFVLSLLFVGSCG